jgi:hypothetical protein
MKKVEKVFGPLLQNGRKYDFKTPGTPSFNIIRPETEEQKISDEKQKIYRSAVGTLLYFVKHSRPDIANVVRELSKCMDYATEAAFKEMKRVLRFIISTKEFGLKIEPKIDNKLSWNLNVYTDSDWAGDKETRKSVTGFIIFFCSVPIFWKSKAQKAVALSSSEAEYYAMAEAAKEIKFVVMMLKDIGIEVDYPIIVNVDNIGAIFMSENASATNRTRHVDARYHYVREFVDEGFLKIIFVKSKENKADIFTKNVNGETYEFHLESYLTKKMDV